MGGRVKGNFGGAQVFSPLAYQNPNSPIWRENLGDFISTQSIKFLSLFLLRWTWKSQVPLAFDYASTNLIIFSYFLVNIVHHFFFSHFFLISFSSSCFWPTFLSFSSFYIPISSIHCLFTSLFQVSFFFLFLFHPFWIQLLPFKIVT